QLGELIQCSIPTNWPPVDWEPHVFTNLLQLFEQHPKQIGWHRYTALRHDDGSRTLIGCTGAYWRESTPSECELGYSILPPREGQGLATEAARAIIAYIRNVQASENGHVPRLTSLVAHTFPHLAGS